MNGFVAYSKISETGITFIVSNTLFELRFNGPAAIFYQILFMDDVRIKSEIFEEFNDQINSAGVHAWLRSIARRYFDGITDDEIEKLDAGINVINIPEKVKHDTISIRPLSTFVFGVGLFGSLYTAMTSLPIINIPAIGSAILLMLTADFLLLNKKKEEGKK